MQRPSIKKSAARRTQGRSTSCCVYHFSDLCPNYQLRGSPVVAHIHAGSLRPSCTLCMILFLRIHSLICSGDSVVCFAVVTSRQTTSRRSRKDVRRYHLRPNIQIKNLKDGCLADYFKILIVYYFILVIPSAKSGDYVVISDINS